MESLFLLAFGEEEFFIAFAMACSEAFFNSLLVALPYKWIFQLENGPLNTPSQSTVNANTEVIIV